MYTQVEEINLVSDLVYALGLDVNPSDNTLMDQDTQQAIIFEGKNIKVTRNALKPAYISANDVKLDPTDPKCTKLMSRLFGFFLDKSTENGDIPKVLAYFFDDETEDKKVKLIVKYEGGTVFESDEFRNKAIVYTDAIFKIDGSFYYDLKKFDLDEDVDVSRRK